MIDPLIESYKRAATERERAQIENAVWDALPPHQRLRDRSVTLAPLLGTSQFSIKQRQYLLGAKGATLLWTYIDERGMALATAVRLHRKARHTVAESGGKLHEVLRDIVTQHHARPAGREKPRRVAYGNVSAKKFWGDLRAQIMSYVQSEFPDATVADKVAWSDFETDIKTAMSDLRRRLTESKKTRADHEVTRSRRTIRDAFETLGLDPPRRGRPIDIKAATRNKRKLARLYHPDANGGSHETAEAYQAVMDAFALVEQLHQEQQENGNA